MTSVNVRAFCPRMQHANLATADAKSLVREEKIEALRPNTRASSRPRRIAC
jgi:hypothetical protein